MENQALQGPPRRRLFLGTAAVIAALATARSGFAMMEYSKSDVNVDEHGLAMRGYDPVSYQTGPKPVLGDPKFTAAYEGATYRFTSAANRATFVANPARYAPQYGGFCAMGVAMGRKLDGDPTLYTVVDNKLYLNVNAQVQERFRSDLPANVRQAETKWPTLRGKSPSETNG